MTTTSSTTTSLTDATVALRTDLRSQLGTALDPFDAEAEALGQRDFASGVPAVGSHAPDFSLPDTKGDDVELSTLLAAGPVVLVFYRGAWCPYCNLQVAAFNASLDELKAAGATLVAISPQTPDSSQSFADQQQLRFHVLSDVGNKVARSYGLVFRQSEVTTTMLRAAGSDLERLNGDNSRELPVASTFVIAPDGRVLFASISGDYRWRVGPEEVLAVLRAR